MLRQLTNVATVNHGTLNLCVCHVWEAVKEELQLGLGPQLQITVLVDFFHPSSSSILPLGITPPPQYNMEDENISEILT